MDTNFQEAHLGAYDGKKETYRSDTGLQVFKLKCGKHVTLMQSKSYGNKIAEQKKNDHEMQVLELPKCYRCGQKGRKPSEHELDAYAVLDRVCGQTLWVAEVRILKRFGGAVDIFIPVYNLIVQIDGEQHFAGKFHSCTAAEQAINDDKMNKRAWEQGFKVLRVHHHDSRSFGAHLHRAIAECITLPNYKFIDFTKSWPHAKPVFQKNGDSIDGVR